MNGAFQLAVINHQTIACKAAVEFQTDVSVVSGIVEVVPQVFGNGFRGAKLLGIISAQSLVVIVVG